MLQERILLHSRCILTSITDNIVTGCKNGWINATVRTGRGIRILVFFFPPFLRKKKSSIFLCLFFHLEKTEEGKRGIVPTFIRRLGKN